MSILSLVAFLLTLLHVLVTPVSDILYVVTIEPTENWSVEHVLQWHLLQSHASTDQKHAELVESLQRQFEERKQELLRIMEGDENVASASSKSNMMVAAPSKGAKAYNAAISKQAFAAVTTFVAKKVEAIHVQVTTGPHAGMTVTVQPKPNSACLVGRSAGKKFREKGVSLSKDSEVSTTHGKFEIISGKAYFTDVGSTNGTVCKDRALATNEAFLLEEPVELILGGSTLRITLS